MKTSILEKLARKSSNLLALLALGTLALNTLVLLILLLQQAAIYDLSRKPPPMFVEMADGRTVPVASKPSNYREPQIVKQFTLTVMTMLLSASNQLPTANGKIVQDKGVDLGRGKITQAAWEAGFAVSRDFRNELLLEIAAIQKNVFTSDTQLSLEIAEASEPQELKNSAKPNAFSGKWTVDLVAYINVLRRQGAENQYAVVGQIPFTRRVFVQAVPIPVTPANATQAQKAASALRASGLEIYAVRDLKIDKYGTSNDANNTGS